MDRRSGLHKKFKALFVHTDPHVYFQPPESVKMVYPCIVYKLSGMPDGYADNIVYFEQRKYQVTVIDPDPDSKLREKVAQMKGARFIRPYVADNLNHFVFEVKY